MANKQRCKEYWVSSHAIAEIVKMFDLKFKVFCFKATFCICRAYLEYLLSVGIQMCEN